MSPAGFALADDGLLLKTPPSCVTTCVTLALEVVTVTLAILDVAAGLPATEYENDPFPVPEVPEVNVSQD
jgi:hypothetical protein